MQTALLSLDDADPTAGRTAASPLANQYDAYPVVVLRRVRMLGLISSHSVWEMGSIERSIYSHFL